MFCTSCGKEVEAGKAFCSSCGAAMPAGQGEQPTEPTQVVVKQPATPAQPPAGAPQQPAGAYPQGGAPVPEAPGKRYGLMALIAGLVFVICAGGAIAAYLLLRDGGQGSATESSVIGVTGTSADSDVTTPGDTTGTTATGGSGEVVDLAKRATIAASSVLAKAGSVDYEEENLIDKKPGTCWAEGVSGYGVGEFVQFTFAHPVTVSELRIVPGYDKVAGGWDRWTSNGRVRSFDLVFSDGTTESFTVNDDRDMQFILLTAPHTVTSVRFVITAVYEAAAGPHKAEDTSVAELHLWGTD